MLSSTVWCEIPEIAKGLVRNNRVGQKGPLAKFEMGLDGTKGAFEYRLCGRTLNTNLIQVRGWYDCVTRVLKARTGEKVDCVPVS